MEKSTEEIEVLRRIRLTRVLVGDTTIPFLKGRPDRERISKDDALDLKILLNTAKSLDDFLYNC